MGGKSPVAASEKQRAALTALARSRDRARPTGRVRASDPSGWTSARIAEAFGVREDTVRLWRSDFGKGGVAALEASIAPGPPPVKSKTALRDGHAVARPAGGRPTNWSIARLSAEIEAREGVRISRSRLSEASAKKNFRWRRRPAHAERTQTASEVDRIGLRLQLRKRQAEAGDIVLLYGDESEALTASLDLARAWAKAGADLRGARAGTAEEGGDAGVARSCHPRTHRRHQPKQAQHRLRGPSRATR